jgi:hypothetical protein
MTLNLEHPSNLTRRLQHEVDRRGLLAEECAIQLLDESLSHQHASSGQIEAAAQPQPALGDPFSRIGLPIRTAPGDLQEGLAGLAGLWDDGEEFADEVERIVDHRTPPRPLAALRPLRTF